MSESMELAVKKGMYWLDQTVENWPSLIDLKELNLNNTSCCVIGQVFGGYHRLAEALDLSGYSPEWSEWAREHGFYWSDEDRYPELTELWRERISGT